MVETNEDLKKKRGMPRGMYTGSALIGFSIFMFLCWVISFITVKEYVEQGIGNVANFMTILILIPIFGFMIPMLLGIRILRRARKEAERQAYVDEQENSAARD